MVLVVVILVMVGALTVDVTLAVVMSVILSLEGLHLLVSDRFMLVESFQILTRSVTGCNGIHLLVWMVLFCDVDVLIFGMNLVVVVLLVLLLVQMVLFLQWTW